MGCVQAEISVVQGITPIRINVLQKLPVTLEFLSALSRSVNCDIQTGKIKWRTRDASTFLYRGGRSQVSMASAFNKQFSGKPAFDADTSHGYKNGSFLGRRIYAHQVVWFLASGEWPSNVIDHINGDKCDNRIENLRHCTQSINSRNAAMPATNTSGDVGVCWDKHKRKWRAAAMVNQKTIFLGNFATKDEAVAARQAANKIHHFTDRHGS